MLDYTIKSFHNKKFKNQTTTSEFTKRLDVVLVVDVSWSLEEVYMKTLELAKDIIYGLAIENDVVRVGVITYDSDTFVELPLNMNINNKHNLIEMIDFYRIVGRTNTQSALTAFLENQLGKNGDRPNVPNVLVVLTDGHSNINPELTVPKAVEIKNLNNTIIAVAMNDDINMNEVRGIASSEDHIFRCPSASSAFETTRNVLRKLAQ